MGDSFDIKSAFKHISSFGLPSSISSISPLAGQVVGARTVGPRAAAGPVGVFAAFLFPKIGEVGGIGGVSTGLSGRYAVITGDGFERTSSSPQAIVPIVFGTTTVFGNYVDFYLLAESNKRLFGVIGICQGSSTLNSLLVDSIDITTLPNYSSTPGDPTNTWFQYFSNGVSSGAIELVNSGKKQFNISGFNGDIISTSATRFFNVVSGKNEARAFLSCDVPGIIEDFLETDNADYTSLDAKTLVIEIAGTADTVIYRNARQTSGASYAAMNGLTLQVTTTVGLQIVTFSAAAVDATTTAAEITAQASNLSVTVVGAEIKIEPVLSAGAITTIAGTAAAQLNFVSISFTHTATTAVADINAQTNGITASVINVDEIKILATLDNKLLEITGGTAESQLNFVASRNFGTVVSYTLKAQKKETTTQITIASDTDVSLEFLDGAGFPQQSSLFVEYSGNFYIDISLTESGEWFFILEITRADNGARLLINTIEVMSDFIKTTDPDYSDLTGKTLVLKINGTERTATFTAAAVDATTTVSEINDQIGTVATATADGTDIDIEALAGPVGTDKAFEIKSISGVGGTATALGFASIYAAEEIYRFKNTSYCVVNIIKSQTISNNPRFQFNITSRTSNPATALLDIYTDIQFLNIDDEIDIESFEGSASFCDDNGYTTNVAFMDISYGGAIKSLMNAGSLQIVRTGGQYKCIPDIDTQVVAEYSDHDMVPRSFRWGLMEERNKANRIRVTYAESQELNTLQDIIVEDVETIERDGYVREESYELVPVTDVINAYKLGSQAFKKQLLADIWCEFELGIKDAYIEIWDIITITIQIPIEVNGEETLIKNKKFRVVKIEETESLGIKVFCIEHFAEMYNFNLEPGPHAWHPTEG